MRIDYWKEERESALVVDGGLRAKCDHSEQTGKLVLKLWAPKGIKPFAHYSFRNYGQMNEYLAKQIAAQKSHVESVKERRQSRHGSDDDLKKLALGQIYVYSWGYEQTNIDFYQITEIHGRMVTLREIGCSTVDRGPGYSSMSDHRIAVKDSFIEKSAPIVKRVYFYGGNPTFSMAHGCLSLWDGKPEYCSWYA